MSVSLKHAVVHAICSYMHICKLRVEVINHAAAQLVLFTCASVKCYFAFTAEEEEKEGASVEYCSM